MTLTYPSATRPEIEFRIREFRMFVDCDHQTGNAEGVYLWASQAARLGRVLLREDGLLHG